MRIIKTKRQPIQGDLLVLCEHPTCPHGMIAAKYYATWTQKTNNNQVQQRVRYMCEFCAMKTASKRKINIELEGENEKEK